jgi:hypothetical protein
MYIFCCITNGEGPQGGVAQIFFLECYTMHGSYYAIILFSMQLTVASATVFFNMPVNLPVRISQFLLLKTFELIVQMYIVCIEYLYYRMVQKIPLTFVLSFCNCLGRRNKIFLDRSKRKTQFSIETTNSLYSFSVKYCTSLFYCTVHIMAGAALLVV